MRAIVVDEPGSVDVLKLREVDIPEPKAGQVRIKVAYSVRNFFEVLTRGGRYLRTPRYPTLLGGVAGGCGGRRAVVTEPGRDVGIDRAMTADALCPCGISVVWV